MKIKKISLNEEGIVSILVTIVMMIVLTLLVLGLAQIGVSDQQNALKRQLSTEAYYLAESGINYSINNNYPSNTCSNGGIIIDNTTKASIPCVFSSISTNNLYQLNSGQSKVVPLSGTDKINSINLSWTGSNTTAISVNQCSNSGLTKVASWNCPYPILMVNVISADLLQSGNNIDTLFKENLTDGITTLYLYPYYNGAGNSSTITSINQIIKVDCHSGTSCSVNINPGSITQNLHQFYLRITPIYGSTSIALSGTVINSGTIKSNQTAIDSTGKVGNTSQRLYNRISTSTSINLSNQGSSDQTPLFGIQTTQDLCKNFQGYYNSPTDNVFNTASKTGPNSNSSPACQ